MDMSELFEYYINGEDCRFKYAKGKPSVSGREFHNYDEIVLFIGGEAQLISKNIQLSLLPKTLILIPREHFHQFIVAKDENYHRCILDFREAPELGPLISDVMSSVTVIPNPSERVLSVFDCLMQATNSSLSEKEKTLLLRAALVQLLVEQKLLSSKPIREFVTVSKLTRDALDYIDAHLAQELKLEGIAAFLNVSVSSLSHHFRKELNISVYRYISEKRLSSARQYIEKGTTLGNAAALSGFKDYSGFFRLYKSYYGKTPSGEIKETKIKP